MRLTAMDLEKKSFSRKKLGGYDEGEIRDFLKLVSRELETLTSENRNLKEQQEILKNQVQEYNDLERTLKQTLVAAQKTSSETRANAEKESELIIREAELNAEKILDESKLELEEIHREIRELKKQKRILKVELKTTLLSYLEMLEEDLSTHQGGKEKNLEHQIHNVPHIQKVKSEDSGFFS